MTNEETIKMALKKKLPVQPIIYSKRYFINKKKHLFEPGVYLTLLFILLYTMFLCFTNHTGLFDYFRPHYNIGDADHRNRWLVGK